MYSATNLFFFPNRKTKMYQFCRWYQYRLTPASAYKITGYGVYNGKLTPWHGYCVTDTSIIQREIENAKTAC